MGVAVPYEQVDQRNILIGVGYCSPLLIVGMYALASNKARSVCDSTLYVNNFMRPVIQSDEPLVISYYIYNCACLETVAYLSRNVGADKVPGRWRE